MTTTRIVQIVRVLILLPLMGLTATAWAEPATALRVEYHQWQVGKDGIRQDVSYTENLYRQPKQIWIERDIPEAARSHHDGHNHAGLGHKHADVTGAPLWITSDEKGQVDVKLVDREEQRLIEIDEPYYSNVGFDGNWAETWYLLEPQSLKALTPASVAANGVETYQIQRNHQRITLVWDPEREYAVSIAAKADNGLSGRTITVKEAADPAPQPWDMVTGYRMRDYSDLLD